MLLILIAALAMLPAAGCLDSAIGKRVREAFGPQFVTDLTSALSAGEDADSAADPLAPALIDALGALIQPRTSAAFDLPDP